jgi:hypothetical protein
MPGRTPDKLRAGAPFQVREATWNELIETKEDRARQRISIPKELRHVPISTDKIKIRNDSGSARRLGEVLEIDNDILISIVDPEHLWQMGIAPDLTHPFGILRHPVLTNQIDELQVSGVCKALVNMTNIEHQYARVKCGLFVLESAVSGPLRILYQPETLGEQECIVLFTGEAPAAILEGELAADLCPLDEEASVANCKMMPNCRDYAPPASSVKNPRHHAGEAGAKFAAYYKKCQPTDAADCETAGDEEWIIFEIELREVCYVIGVEDREGGLVAAGLKTPQEWCPDGEPDTACEIVPYSDCDVDLPATDTSWTFTPLYACCGQIGDEAAP